MGPFMLRMECSHHFELKPIPQEGAGMYHKAIRGAWFALFMRWIVVGTDIHYFRDAQTAAGSPNFKRYLYNPMYEVKVSAVTQLK
jgi:calpain-7